MAADLYAQIRMIEQQCALRRLSQQETDALLSLCPYAFARRFPRRASPALGSRGRVFTALH